MGKAIKYKVKLYMKSNCCKVKCHFHIGNYMEDDSTRKRKID